MYGDTPRSDPCGFYARMLAAREAAELPQRLLEVAIARANHIEGGIGCCCDKCTGAVGADDVPEGEPFMVGEFQAYHPNKARTK